MQLDFQLTKEEKKVRSLMKTVKWEQNFPEIFNYDKASCKLAQYKIKGIIKRGKKIDRWWKLLNGGRISWKHSIMTRLLANLLNMKLKVKTNTGNTDGCLKNMKMEKHNINLIIEKENICLSQKAKEKFDFCLKRSKFNNVL